MSAKVYMTAIGTPKTSLVLDLTIDYNLIRGDRKPTSRKIGKKRGIPSSFPCHQVLDWGTIPVFPMEKKKGQIMFEIKNYFHNADIPVEDLGNGLKRKVLAYHDNLMAVEVYLEKGAEGVMHTHPHEQIGYVLKGKFEFNIDGKKQVIEPGDTVYLEANVPHGVICLEAGILLDIFTPYREEFIQKEVEN